MPYVQRDYDGKVKGLFAQPQPGYAEEFLPDDNKEVRAYKKLHPAPVIREFISDEIKTLNRQSEAAKNELKELGKATGIVNLDHTPWNRTSKGCFLTATSTLSTYRHPQMSYLAAGKLTPPSLKFIS